MAKLMTVKRRLERAIRSSDSAEELTDAILEIMEDASEDDAETAASVLAQHIFDCERSSDDYADAA